MRSFITLTLLLACTVLAQSTLPAAGPGNVTMTLEEYDKLVVLAGKQTKKPEAPPLPYVIKSAQLNLKVNSDWVSGTMVLEGEVYAKGYRKVPLASGLVVLDAKQRTGDLPIEQENGSYIALLPGQSEFTVTLDVGMPVASEPGRASFSLQAPSAGAVRLNLLVPGEQSQVHLSPGTITSQSSGEGHTSVEATLIPGQTVSIWRAARVTAAPAAPKELRFLSDVKTLISVHESDIAIAALADITVIQGEANRFEIQAPEGYELTSATGPTLISGELQPRSKSIVLNVLAIGNKNHQFLLALTKSNLATTAEIPLLTFIGTQRETGEVMVEGDGAMELAAEQRGGLHRMDIKEASPYLRSLARAPLHTAFRYTKRPADAPGVSLAWTRFPDSVVLSAVAQRAVVTTLVTTEGRSLTEVKLTLKNQAQPFLKVALPQGASILSADVAGEKVKPVMGADGNRVPLLRPNFRPAGEYEVSFVFMHAGAPFEKKGGAELSLPKLDIPIGLLEWEVFLPQRYKVSDFGGDAFSERWLPPPSEDSREIGPARLEMASSLGHITPGVMLPGQVGGVVVDASGVGISRATVTVLNVATGVTQKTVTDAAGRWRINYMASGHLRITTNSPGFQTQVTETDHDAGRSSAMTTRLNVGTVTETVTVTAEANRVDIAPQRNFKQEMLLADAASVNVAELQRRVAGVLPIAVNVPHAGNAYKFVRPLVLDEETKLTFSYRSK